MKKGLWSLPLLLLAAFVAGAQAQDSDKTIASEQAATVAVQSSFAGRWTGGFWLSVISGFVLQRIPGT